MPVQPPTKPKHFHVLQKDRAYFTSNLAILLKAAVPLGQALASLRQTSESRSLAKAIASMERDIQEGLTLSQALERSQLVSQQTLTLVQFGERAGTLAENLRVAAKQEEKQRVFRAKVRSALMYPSFVLSMTFIIGLSVAWFLLPRLADTFSGLKVKLPLITQLFINFGTFMKANGVWFVPALIITLAVAAYVVFWWPKTRAVGQWVLMHTPGVGGLLREVEIARFGYLLGTLLEAGLTMAQGLQLLRDAVTLPGYQRVYRDLCELFDEGLSFQKSFAKLENTRQWLPPPVQQMVIAGEQSGTLSQTLLTIGADYEEKADISIKNLEVILEPILLVIVWFGVLSVAISVILPIYSLIGGLQG